MALFATYVVWGSTFLGMRIALEGLPPFLMAGSRFIIAGGGLLLILRGRGELWPLRRQWGGAALVGVLLLGGGNGGIVLAQHLGVTSGMAALGAATVPLWASVFSGLWGEWPTRCEWIGLAVGFAGVICLNLEGGLRASPWGLSRCWFPPRAGHWVPFGAAACHCPPACLHRGRRCCAGGYFCLRRVQ
ncbi:MAG: EamA family transporter [Janthinobacterium lividum]